MLNPKQSERDPRFIRKAYFANVPFKRMFRKTLSIIDSNSLHTLKRVVYCDEENCVFWTCSLFFGYFLGLLFVEL